MQHDTTIRIRIPETDKRRLVEFARHRGMTLSAFLRTTATEAAERAAA